MQSVHTVHMGILVNSSLSRLSSRRLGVEIPPYEHVQPRHAAAAQKKDDFGRSSLRVDVAPDSIMPVLIPSHALTDSAGAERMFDDGDVSILCARTYVCCESIHISQLSRK